jgi:hypothetical protein
MWDITLDGAHNFFVGPGAVMVHNACIHPNVLEDANAQYPKQALNGALAELTANQAAAFPGIQAGGAVPAGARAAEAGLTVGEAPPPMYVLRINLPWPLP